MKNYKSVNRWFCIAVLFFMIHSSAFAQLDWGQKVVESTMTRRSAEQLGAWQYSIGFYLFGQYRIWKMTGDARYFQYIRDWVDSHVDEQGNIDASIGNLDNSQPGLITLLCYVETGEEKYKLAAQYIRNLYNTYPRTSDGGFWHGQGNVGQLWADGAYMICPFLANYAKVLNDTSLYTEAANQIIIYASHLQDTTGLLFHAYDEDGSSSWADPVTHHSPWFWGRAIGWFGMAITEILEVMPPDHPKRSQLIQILSDLIKGLADVQDESGLWYQVVDQGDQPDNWLESSCSCMYSYVTARAAQNGYVDSAYLDTAVRGYEGVVREKITIDADSLVSLHDICQGTGVSSDYSYYINRQKNTNDYHGLGAFLMMCWQMAGYDITDHINSLPAVQITSPADSSFFWPGTDISIMANGYDFDGEVSQITFYEGNNILSTDDQMPWMFTWPQVSKGIYTLYAEALDDSGATALSDPVHIFVTDTVFYQEAEEGTISDGTVDTNHEGYTGTGFVNLANATGTYLELTLQMPESGIWHIAFRYANGTTDNRPCEISVNGNVTESSFDFPPTGSWTDWLYSNDLILDLEAGECVIRITGNTSASAPNLDHLKCVWEGNEGGITGSTNRPDGFFLYQNHPNPFNSETMIRFEIQSSSLVSAKIYDTIGRCLNSIPDKLYSPGIHEIRFDGKDLSTGIYFYEVIAGEFQAKKKMLLIK